MFKHLMLRSYPEYGGVFLLRWNSILMAPYSAEEVRKALFSIGDFKAHGPDELHAAFYKRFWSMLGMTLLSRFLKQLILG